MAGRKPFPVALAARWNRIHGEVTATTPSDEVALVPRWRAHVDAEARRLGVTIAWTATAMNAYAVASRKEIEISPIVSAFSYATARHELGHVARPCQPSHRRVTSDAALKKTVCVRCELAAWCWAQEDAQPGWTARMQECLAQSLPTYAEYATKAERQEIEELVSGIGFRRAQLARIRRTA
jgi:hypothetical protein